MPYTLLKTNGQKLTVVQDSTVDTTTDLVFVGKNYTGYGSPVNENFVKLLENFSNDIQPSKPLTGQVWFDSANKKLKVYDGKIFKSLGFMYTGATPVNPTQGDLWLNTSSKLKVFDSVLGWQDVSQPSAGNFGNSSSGGLTSVTIKDSNNIDKTIVPLTVLGNTATIISTASVFAVNPSESIAGKFSKIYPGITLPSTDSNGISAYYGTLSVVNGNVLWGTAASALGLVKHDGLSVSILKPADFVLRSEFTSGFPSLSVADDEGISIGVQKVLKIHVAPSSVANISLINGSSLNFNLNTGNGTYTNIISLDGTSGLKVLPNANLAVSLGDVTRRFSNIFVSTATLTTLNAAAIVSTSITATNFTSTNITGSVIRGLELYDNGSRVLTQATIPSSGVGTISGTSNQILVNGGTSPTTGSVTLSLPNTVNLNNLNASSIIASSLTVPTFNATTVTASIIQATGAIYGAAIYDNGVRVLTGASVVSALVGTPRQVLVNGGVNITSGTVTLSLPQNIDTTSTPVFASLSVGTGPLIAGAITSRSLNAGTGTVISGLVSATSVLASNLTVTSLTLGSGLSVPGVLTATSFVSTGSLNVGTGAIAGGSLNVGTGTILAGPITSSALSARNGSASMIGNWSMDGNLTLQATTLSVGSGTVTTKILSAYQGTATIVGNWTLNGGTLQATYADLAERYCADQVYEPGTVLVVGGLAEVTTTDRYADTAVAGIVSTAPAYTMNANAGSDTTHPFIALKGRVPCKIHGPVRKGDLLVTSTMPGYAERANGREHPAAVLGRALQNFDGGTGVIEVMVA